MKTLISVSELEQIENPLVFDCRYSLADQNYGHLEYKKNHIPGAIHVDINRDLSAEVVPGKTGRHPLPLAKDFEARLQQWGLNSEQQVIAYDDAGGAFAARLWWMLRWLGHANVAVLDGGFGAWLAAGGDVSTDVPTPLTSRFKASTSLTLTIQAEDILVFDGLVTDARETARFNGTTEPIDPIAGHIPNARCLPFSQNLTPSQHFKSLAALQDQFHQFGIPADQSTVCYCGSGVTAAHNILALIHAGYPEPILYPGSWSEWITNPDHPVATTDG